jgi:hypothetical protein
MVGGGGGYEEHSSFPTLASSSIVHPTGNFAKAPRSPHGLVLSSSHTSSGLSLACVANDEPTRLSRILHPYIHIHTHAPRDLYTHTHPEIYTFTYPSRRHQGAPRGRTNTNGRCVSFARAAAPRSRRYATPAHDDVRARHACPIYQYLIYTRYIGMLMCSHYRYSRCQCVRNVSDAIYSPYIPYTRSASPHCILHARRVGSSARVSITSVHTTYTIYTTSA